MTDTIINEKGLTFNELEEKVYKMCLEWGQYILKNILEKIDEHLKEKRDKSRYRHKGYKSTTIKTLMGPVPFSRVYYKDEKYTDENVYVHLLDKVMQFDTIGLISTNLAQIIAEGACITSYRNTAENILNIAGQSISHTGAWDVVQALGEKIKKDEETYVDKLEQDELFGKKETPILFEEADGVYINMQGEDRPKRGSMLEMKVAVAYEGWEEVSKDRYELINKIAYAGFENASKFYKKKEAMIAKEYNIDEINLRILNGDGAPWITRGMDDTVHYQLDPYHKNKAVITNVSCAKARQVIFSYLRENDIKGVLGYIDRLFNSTEDEKAKKNLRKLYTYFNQNQEGLIPYKERGLDIPTPPPGVHYRNLGTMEHHICDIIALRMKNRKCSWSINGAENLAKLLTAKATGRLKRTIKSFSKIVLPPTKTREITRILSAAKAPKVDGKGYAGAINESQVPFRNSAVTNGRKAIRTMFDMRDFTDLIYR